MHCCCDAFRPVWAGCCNSVHGHIDVMGVVLLLARRCDCSLSVMGPALYTRSLIARTLWRNVGALIREYHFIALLCIQFSQRPNQT